MLILTRETVSRELMTLYICPKVKS